MGPAARRFFFAGFLSLAGCPKDPPAPDLAMSVDDLADEEPDGAPVEDGRLVPADLRRDDGPLPDLAGDLPPHVPVPYVPICTPSKWCWENPLPQGNALSAVWSFSSTDVWAAGGLGTILHYDGTAWAAVPSGTEAYIGGLWGSAPNNLWATCSDGNLLRWNGTAWSKVAGGTTNALGPIWGTSATDIWAGGDKGTLVHWDGTAWTPKDNSVGLMILGLFGTAPNDYFATFATGGIGSPVIHWNGAAWSRVTGYPPANYAKAVWGGAPNRIWFFSSAPVRFNGTSYGSSSPLRSVPVTAAWGASADDVWSVGGQSVGRVKSFFDRWDLGPAPTMDRDESLFSVSGTTSNDVWTTSYRLHHWNGSSWATTGSGAAGGSRPTLRSGWASSATDAWVVGMATDGMGRDIGPIFRRTGAGWRRMFDAPNYLFGIHGFGPSTIWAVGGQGSIFNWDGVMWKSVPSSTTATLNSVHGSSPNSLFAVGEAGTIVVWDGAKWTSTRSGSAVYLSSVWSSAANDAWVVGNDGISLRWDGSTWTSVATGTTEDLFSIWGSSPNDIWAGGRNGVLIRWDGTRWSRVSSGVTRTITSIHGSGVTRVWMITSGSLSARSQTLLWNGVTLQDIPSPVNSLTDIFAYDTSAWTVGSQGEILLFKP